MKLWTSHARTATRISLAVILAVFSGYDSARASTLGYPQDVPTFQYVEKAVSIGNQTQTVHGIAVENDPGYYVNGADLQKLLAYYLVQSNDIEPGSAIELTPNAFEFDPLSATPQLPTQPFPESSPLPSYAYKCGLYVNRQLVGYAATLEIDDGKISPNTDTIYIRVSDLSPLLNILGIGNQWTRSTWQLQAPKNPVDVAADPSSLTYMADSSGIIGLSRSPSE